MEHRWGVRIPLGIKVRLRGGCSCIGTALLRDASVSGGFLETGMRPPILAQLAVEVRFASEAGIEILEIPALVVREDDAGIGVEWQEFTPQAIRLLLPSVRAYPVDLPGALSRSASMQK
jgi:hypothetical protein